MTSVGTPVDRSVQLRVSIVCAVTLLGLVACGGSDGSGASSEAELNQAVELIAGKIEPNDFGIEAADLEARANAYGKGIFVYLPKEIGGRDDLFAAWIVVGEDAFPLGIPAKLATPSLDCPCNAPRGFWEDVGLNPYQSSQAFEELVLADR